MLSWIIATIAITACGSPPPTVENLRQAYAAHVEEDRVHKTGLQAQEAPVVIPNQQPNCTRDGGAHFDCRIRVIFETEGRKRSQEQVVHIKREGGAWIIDSLD